MINISIFIGKGPAAASLMLYVEIYNLLSRVQLGGVLNKGLPSLLVGKSLFLLGGISYQTEGAAAKPDRLATKISDRA
jgi:hypothetical protein